MASTDADPDMQAVLVEQPAAPSVSGAEDPDMAAVRNANSQSTPGWFSREVFQPLGRAARNIIGGAAALPAMAGNAGIEAGNFVNRGLGALGVKTYPELQVQPVDVDQVLTRMGLPQNQTFGQKVVGMLESGMAGAAALPNPGVGYENAGVAASPLTGAQQSALGAGSHVGMRPTPGQASGSVPMQQVESYFESHPWTAGPAQAVSASNQAALNRAWAAQIGEQSDTVDSTVLSRAVDRLGQVFDGVRDQTPRTLDEPTVISGLNKIDADYEGMLPGNAKITDHPLVQNLLKFAANGNASGEQLGALSSKLGRVAAKQMTTPAGDRDLGMALYQVKDGVDDLVAQGLSPEDAAAYDQARSQYRALMQLTGRSGNLNPTTGNVNGRSMATYLQGTDRRGFLYGGNQSPAYDATRFAQAFQPVVGNSGTATRGLGVSDIWQLPVGIPLNLAARLYYRGALPDLTSKGAAQAEAGIIGAAEQQ